MTNISSPLRIIGLVGSLRDKSYTRLAVQQVLEGARQAGADATLIDLRSLKLPFCQQAGAEAFGDVETLLREIRSAHGAVWGTPEYHGSFSGLLKNALDLTDPEDWRGKVVGLVGVSGGPAGPGAALLGLRSVCRGLGVLALPDQISIAIAKREIDEAGAFRSPEFAQGLANYGAELVRLAERLRRDGNQA